MNCSRINCCVFSLYKTSIKSFTHCLSWSSALTARILALTCSGSSSLQINKLLERPAAIANVALTIPRYVSSSSNDAAIKFVLIGIIFKFLGLDTTSSSVAFDTPSFKVINPEYSLKRGN